MLLNQTSSSTLLFLPLDSILGLSSSSLEPIISPSAASYFVQPHSAIWQGPPPTSNPADVRFLSSRRSKVWWGNAYIMMAARFIYAVSAKIRCDQHLGIILRLVVESRLPDNTRQTRTLGIFSPTLRAIRSHTCPSSVTHTVRHSQHSTCSPVHRVYELCVSRVMK